MNKHLAYFLTALGETLALYFILSYIERAYEEIKQPHVAMILITNFVSAYTGFYLLPWLSSF